MPNQDVNTFNKMLKNSIFRHYLAIVSVLGFICIVFVQIEYNRDLEKLSRRKHCDNTYQKYRHYRSR